MWAAPPPASALLSPGLSPLPPLPTPHPPPPCGSLLRLPWGGPCGVLVGWVAQKVPRRDVVAGLVALCLPVAQGH